MFACWWNRCNKTVTLIRAPSASHVNVWSTPIFQTKNNFGISKSRAGSCVVIFHDFALLPCWVTTIISYKRGEKSNNRRYLGTFLIACKITGLSLKKTSTRILYGQCRLFSILRWKELLKGDIACFEKNCYLLLARRWLNALKIWSFHCRMIVESCGTIFTHSENLLDQLSNSKK